jgi:hypothetical protein
MREAREIRFQPLISSHVDWAFTPLHHSIYPTVADDANVGEKLKWGRPQCAWCSRDVRRYIVHEKGLKRVRLWPAIRSLVGLNNTTLCIFCITV